MKCYMSRPRPLQESCKDILQIKLVGRTPQLCTILGVPNKNHMKLDWSLQTLQTCSKQPVLNKFYFYTFVQTKHDPQNYMLFPFASHVCFGLPKWCFPLIRNGLYPVEPVTPSSSSSRMLDVQMATAAKHKTSAACN